MWAVIVGKKYAAGLLFPLIVPNTPVGICPDCVFSSESYVIVRTLHVLLLESPLLFVQHCPQPRGPQCVFLLLTSFFLCGFFRSFDFGWVFKFLEVASSFDLVLQSSFYPFFIFFFHLLHILLVYFIIHSLNH